MEGGASGMVAHGRMLSQLLTEMDGVQQMQGVMVIAPTNRVDIIDTALLRPGRFDKIVYVPNPDKNTRFRILEVHAKGKPISRDIDLMKIAEMTNGFSGAEVSAVVNTAISLVLHSTFKSILHLKKQQNILLTPSYPHNISKRQSER